MMLSPIELLHPRGYVRNAIVVGDCPISLRPRVRPPARGGADVVLVGKGADPAGVNAAEDGVIYALGRHRLPGFHAVDFVHVPDARRSTHVAALRSAALIASRRARVAAAIRLPLFDFGTLLFRRRVAPLGWLHEDVSRAVITTSRHGSTRTHVVRTPEKIAKVGAGPSVVPAGLGEGPALRALGPAAAAAGARVPDLLDELELNGVPVTVQTALPGRPASAVLRNKPHDAAEVLKRLTAWLALWNAGTLVRSSPPRVAVHRDLTMWNVLLDGGSVGIVDWGSARPDGEPLTDFFYAALDARAAVDGYRDRTGAFRECFLRGGDWHDLVTGLESRIAVELELPSEVADQAFHACWNHHAENEARRGEGTQFREVAQLASAAR